MVVIADFVVSTSLLVVWPVDHLMLYAAVEGFSTTGAVDLGCLTTHTTVLSRRGIFRKIICFPQLVHLTSSPSRSVF